MKRLSITMLAVMAATINALACTNLIVGKNASTDGSVMISYSADSYGMFGYLYHSPAGTHEKGELIDIYDWDDGTYHGQIAQVAQTYNVIGNMNEFQVSIGETTFGGREELVDRNGIIDYGSLIYITLQRSRTAREAIRVMTDLVQEYGYASSGESFSIADPNEAWIMEMIGKGIRGPHGGAILNRDGKLRKLTLNADGMLSGTVYGDLHPSGRFGVFSTNIILPGLHTHAGDRMEVYDTASDLTVADFDRNLMVNLPHVARADAFETFPCFSADGKSVYYCVADTVSVPRDVKDLRYDLVRADFDTADGRISEQVDTVWSGQLNNASACHPKASPDGRWLMFTVASYGTFPINHNESTLNLIDLQTGEVRALDEIKGDKSDTYHSWSSNSRWFVFASKRGDGHYGKPYFCHIDENGNTTKPFVLPQESSIFYDYNLKSFNLPDLGRESTGMTVKDARRMFKSENEPFAQAY